MVISDKYKYVFIELQHTATTAISEELCLNYGGERICKKHARYHEFLKIATPAQKKYFTFSGLRNPIDEIISIYFKLVTNHKGRFTNPDAWRKDGGSVREKMLRQFKFVSEEGHDFSDYLLKFYQIPYDNWSRLDHKKMDFIIRFENLENDFSSILELLGLEKVRDLPMVNKTKSKGKNINEYIKDEFRTDAINIFGPFMEKWGYEFPSEWGECRVSGKYRMLYNFAGILRFVKWRYLDSTKLKKYL